MEALQEALRLAQAEGAKEASEVAKELSACKEEAAKAAASKPTGAKPTAAGGGPHGISIVPNAADDDVEEISTSPTRGKPGTMKVIKPATLSSSAEIERKAAEVAKRAAEIAKGAPGKGSSLAGAKASLSAFEREFQGLWKQGKGAASTPASVLCDLLSQLPATAAEMSRFIGEGLSEDLLSGLVLATAQAAEPPVTAAARLCALTAVRRFDMCWMFVGKQEKAAATAVLASASGGELADEVAAAAKRYGVQLA